MGPEDSGRGNFSNAIEGELVQSFFMSALNENLPNTLPLRAGKMSKEERIVHTVIWTLVLVLLAVGYFLLRPGMEVIGLARESRSWPETDARVTYAKSEFSYGGDAGSSSYEPVVKYRYTVDGVEHEGETVFFGTTRFQNRSGKAQSLEIVSRYAGNPTVKVRYNPARAAQSVLEPGVTLRSFDSLGWAFLFLGAGVALILFMVWPFSPRARPVEAMQPES
jgi:hypothetical protein